MNGSTVFVQVEALNQSSTYPPPSSDANLGIQSASQCTCGRVPYNLISACSSCQGKSILPYVVSIPWYLTNDSGLTARIDGHHTMPVAEVSLEYTSKLFMFLNCTMSDD